VKRFWTLINIPIVSRLSFLVPAEPDGIDVLSCMVGQLYLETVDPELMSETVSEDLYINVKRRTIMHKWRCADCKCSKTTDQTDC